MSDEEARIYKRPYLHNVRVVDRTGRLVIYVHEGRCYLNGESSETTDVERIGAAFLAWARSITMPVQGKDT